jgi:hypothetical protein
MPPWICAVVGAGVAKPVPGAVLVALAGTRPATLASVPRWQLSQVVLDGMCELGPIGLVAGMPTMLVMPAKLEEVPEATWQATQLFVMPAWFMREPLNFAPFGTGMAVMLEPAPTWQDSQAALVGKWLVGRPTMLKFAAGIAKLGAALPWHCAQFVVVLGALAWMLASVGITEKSLVVWQAVHWALTAYGM